MTQFDDARLVELIDIFGAEDLAMVVDAFLEEAAQAVAGLADLVGCGPDPSREAQFHYLVGAARNLGALEFGDLCKRHQSSQDVFTAADHAELSEVFHKTGDAFLTRIETLVRDAA